MGSDTERVCSSMPPKAASSAAAGELPNFTLENARQHREKGNALYRDGKTREALKCYTETLAILAVSDDLLRSAQKKEDDGSQSAAMGQFDKWQRAQAAVPAMLNKARCHLDLGEAKEAVTCLEGVLLIDPDNVKGLFCRGTARLALQDWLNAHTDLARAAALQPNDVNIANALKEARNKSGNAMQRGVVTAWQGTKEFGTVARAIGGLFVDGLQSGNPVLHVGVGFTGCIVAFTRTSDWMTYAVVVSVLLGVVGAHWWWAVTKLYPSKPEPKEKKETKETETEKVKETMKEEKKKVTEE